MSDHKAAANRATAAFIEIIARGRSLEAAIIRGDGQEAQERVRREAHDLLDAFLDQSAEAATAVRSILEP